MTKDVAAPRKGKATPTPTLRSAGACIGAAKGQRQDTPALRAFLISTVVALVLLAAALVFEIVHERTDWPLGQSGWETANIVVILALMLAFGIFAVTRWGQLVRETTEHKRAEEALRSIVEGTSSATGDEFLRSLACHLASALNVRYAEVGELVDGAQERVRTLAVWTGEGFGDNFEYELAGTPCENVVNQTMCHYPRNVQELFPEDHLLTEMGVESYLGTPLFDSEGNALGLLAVLHDEPMDEASAARSILTIFAARAGAELERKRAEEALRTQRDKFESVIASLADGLDIVSPDYRVHFQNKILSDRFGDLTGKLCYQGYMSRETPCESCPMQKAIATGTAQTVELTAADGREYELTSTPFQDIDGETKAIEIARDISERKRAEDALQESEERYRTLYEDNPSMYFTVDTAGTVLSVNRFGAEELGYTADELVGRSVLKIFYEPDREAVQKQLALCVKNPDQVADWEFRKVRKDGSMLWVKEAARAVRGPRGDTTVLIVCENISERKQAEEALRESDERYRALVESAFEGIIISRAGKILEANESFARMFGYELPEVIGLSPVEMTTPESAELILNNVQSGFEKPYEITGIRKDGATFSIEVIGKNCVYQDREARITALRDITESKLAEEARQQAREELEGRVEHQILRRNPYGLTFRELTVLHLVAAGKSDKEIGIDLGISPLTARKHLSNILTKMGAASRTEAVARGLREGLLD